MPKNPFEEEEIDTEAVRDAEFAPVPDDAPLPTEDEVAAILEPDSSPARNSYDALETEVERRFEVAMCYRMLLKGSLFNDSTDASKTVEKEARAFFKDRLETLLGIRATKPVVAETPLPFDKEEVKVLKEVARRLLKKPELAPPVEKPVQPVLRQAALPASTPTAAVPRTTKPGPKPAARPVAQVKVIQRPPVNRENGPEDTGKIIQQPGGRTYKIVKNDLGTEFKQDITNHGSPKSRLPTLMGAQASQVSEMQAAQQISRLKIDVKGHPVGVQNLVNAVSEE